MALQDDAQIAAALALLQSLKDDIARVLEGLNSVTARLDHMGVFKVEKHKFANVLYVGPSQEALESESGRRLTALSGTGPLSGGGVHYRNTPPAAALHAAQHVAPTAVPPPAVRVCGHAAGHGLW
ncbi:hypothetical protein AX16_006660 [Volvariella volvacea WC 439]|nr:hypothetical protein AX16_006660 [Volvariella volvacea WC 439]